MSTPIDVFRRAVAGLPPGMRWVCHGRDPATGLDCWGFVLAVYREAGLPIDELDLPYGVRDRNRPTRLSLIHERLSAAFHRVAVAVPLDCRPGDVLLVTGGKLVHPGIYLGGRLVEMSHDGLKATIISRAWPWVSGVYRHRRL